MRGHTLILFGNIPLPFELLLITVSGVGVSPIIGFTPCGNKIVSFLVTLAPETSLFQNSKDSGLCPKNNIIYIDQTLS